MTDVLGPLPSLLDAAVATLAQARALLEFWWIWVAVDAVGAPLAVLSGLWVTGIVYGAFFVLCVFGLRDWVGRYRASRRAAAEQVVVT